MTSESGSLAPSVRYRTDRDLDDCARVLAEVHERDDYPVNWPDHPAEWLAQPSPIGAWVAELAGQVVSHVSLSPSAA